MPERRTPEEIKRSFENAKKVMAHQKKKERETDVVWAIWALVIVGGIQVLFGMYLYNQTHDMLSLLIEVGVGAGFLALAYHAKEKPVQALTISLWLYVGVMILLSVATGNSPLNGILIKIIIISTIVSGIKAAKKLPPPKVKSDEEILDDID